MKNSLARTRIAPSPTGFLHIGTARTVLFNYLFAKKNKGKFVLRIEDTDRSRSTKESEQDILEGLKWLGLNWDEGPFYQTKRLDLYKKYAEQLVKSGKAYKKEGAIWFRIDHSQDKISYDDLIHGKITFPTKEFNDFVIIKKDGIPTFIFSNVVDDHEMKISHVIRGEDHITNTPQQILIYQALGWDQPHFAHIPLILNKDRSKMSKRKDPVSITKDFRDRGYLPEAMINYMALLGWNPKNEREFFTLKELEKEFDLKKVNKAGAVFDQERLNYFNSHYLHQLSNRELASRLINFNKNLLKMNKDLLNKIIEVEKSRMVTLVDFPTLDGYFFKTPKYDKKLLIFKKSTPENSKKGLHTSYFILHTSSSRTWENIQELNKVLQEAVKKEGLTNGDVFWPVRVALSGAEKSPSPTELLWVLGKEESLKRIKTAMEVLDGKN